ncbi:MAG: tetratricopeptide repeat protein [Eubacteriales bacterium]|nr:tetratricopeptide repeat protein [Eubacteriales bacterium]
MGRMFKWIFLAVVILLLGIGFRQYNNYEKKREIREDALLYFKEEDYAKTIQYLEEALALRSLFAAGLNHDMTCYLAESHYQLKEYKEAEKIYDKLLSDDPKEAKYYELKGRCAREAGEQKRAVDIFEEGWERTKDSEFLEDICDIYLEEGKYKKALNFTRQGIEAGGETLRQFMFQEVIIYEKSQEYEKAYEAVCKYCEQFPEDERGQREKIFLSTRAA